MEVKNIGWSNVPPLDLRTNNIPDDYHFPREVIGATGIGDASLLEKNIGWSNGLLDRLQANIPTNVIPVDQLIAETETEIRTIGRTLITRLQQTEKALDELEQRKHKLMQDHAQLTDSLNRLQPILGQETR